LRYSKSSEGEFIMNSEKPAKDDARSASRRAALKKLGRYAAVSAPTVTVLLAATAKPKKAVAASVPF
jgi:hypothetical protein